MRRKNKKKYVLFFIIILIIAGVAGFLYYYSINKDNWEKAVRDPIAYMEYLGSYMVFDEEGYVIESLSTPPKDIPLVMGLDFDYVVVSEMLPIEDNKHFELCIDISNALSDADIDINRIELDGNDEIVLYIGGVTVELGTRKDLENKLIHLKRVADNLKNYSAGNLDMKEYNENGEYIFTTKN